MTTVRSLPLALKDREETRHTKVELTEALDKYAHYMFSADPQQREFSYNLFTQLGYAEIALKLGRAAGDQAIRKVAESQVTSSDAAIRGEAARTLAILTSAQRDSIRKLLIRAEGASYDNVYVAPGLGLMFGIFGWSLSAGNSFGTGDLGELLATYIAQPGAVHAADLAPFLDRVKAHDETLASDPAFRSVLKATGSDSVMAAIQNALVDRSLDGSLALSTQYSLRLPLSIAVIHDTRINQGEGGVRKANYQKRYPKLLGLQARAQRYVDLASRGDWWLKSSDDLSEVGNTVAQQK